jgi:glycine cleavage system H lipoate-binding protein
MNALLSALSSIGIFIIGMVARFGLLLVVLAVLAGIFLLGLSVVRGVAWMRRRILGLGAADGVAWKRHGYYAPGHTWVEAAGATTVRLGFDDLAQRVLGHVTALSLPAPGTTIAEGQALTEVVCGDKRAVIPSPVAGTVVAINDAVARDPSLLHRDPYRRGWLVAIEAANTAYTRLLYGEPAREFLTQESKRLTRFFEQELQLHAADGGEFVAPGASFLDALQWRTLTQSFLKTR